MCRLCVVCDVTCDVIVPEQVNDVIDTQHEERLVVVLSHRICHSVWHAEICQVIALPFSSDRQHLSYDDCLEVRGEIIRTVLCCIVY